jgi:hypothetical protein
LNLRGTRTWWESAPWFVRSAFEGLAIAFVVFLVVALIPKFQEVAEKAFQRKVENYTSEIIRGDSEVLGQSGIPPLQRAGVGSDEETHKDEGFEASENDHPLVSHSETMQVGNSEIWRFNLKTDSPKALRLKVIDVFNELKISDKTLGFNGIEAPGGIQFNMLVDRSLISELRSRLEILVIVKTEKGSESASNPDKPFTWFKNKSAKKIPQGYSRVVIWLSQI